MDEIVATPTETIASADIAASLSGERAADMVEALNALPPATAAEVLLYFPVERAVEVLDQPGLDYDSEIVQNLPVERAVPVLSGMAADRVADVFRRMAEPARSEVLGRLDRETQDSLRRLLSYPEHSAGSIMTTEFVSVPADWTIEQTLDHIRRVERTRETVWQRFGFYDYGEHWLLIATTVATALVGIVTFGSLAGSMLPFILQRFGFDPASASAPFVATLVDVTGLVIYFGVAALILSGTLL